MQMLTEPYKPDLARKTKWKGSNLKTQTNKQNIFLFLNFCLQKYLDIIIILWALSLTIISPRVV